MLTKKHFAQARLINSLKQAGEAGVRTSSAPLSNVALAVGEVIHATLCQVAHGLAEQASAENPSFDREHFMQACGF